MTTTPTRTPGAQPPRAPAPPPAGGARRREVIAAVGSLLALLALLVGLPAALAVLVGWPLPSKVPTGSMLLDAARSPITDQLLVNTLACIFWLAWLQIVVCAVIEVRAGVTGIGVPRKVPLAGVTQHLTRKLVASVLLVVTTAAVLTPMTAAVTRAVLADGSSQVSVSAIAVPAGSGPAFAAAAGAQAIGGGIATPDHAALTVDRSPASDEDAARPAHELVGRKVLVVEPPDGRHHMSLWEIAEIHLGDGLRYKEVFALNEGRAQPGGGTIIKARLIQPGWQLLMPDDAVRVPIVAKAPIPASVPVQAPVELAPAGELATPVDSAATSAGASSRSASVQLEPTDGGNQNADPLADEGPLISLLAMAEAGLLSAGLLGGLAQLRKVQQRRRRDGERLPLPPAELLRAEVAARLGQDPESAQELDHALRLLSDRQTASFAALPDVVAAVIERSMLRLVLAEPIRPVPAPFTAVDPLGGSWQVSRDALPEVRPGALSPYPSLVTVGSDAAGGRLLVDLEAIGVLSLSGPRRGTTSVLRAMAVELATSRWADHLRLTLVGFGEELTALQPERVRHVATLAEALPGLEARLASLPVHAQGPGGVLRSRASGGDPLMPELVLIAEQVEPDAPVLERLRMLAASLQRRSGLALVTSEDVPSARWTLRLAVDGTGVVQPFGVELVNRGLDDEAWAAVTALVALATVSAARPEAAGDRSDEPADEPADAPVEGGVRVPGSSFRLPSLADVTFGAVAGASGPVQPLRLVGDAAADTEVVGAAGEVQVLGPVGVDVPAAGPAPHPHCVELVVLLALHPEGLTLPWLAAALHPRDNEADAVRSAQVLLARTRSWLGTDAAGRELLPHSGPNELLRLSPDISLDRDRFRRLVARGSAVPALALVRGPVLSGLPPRRYTWLVPTGLEHDLASEVVDVAALTARTLLAEAQPAAARDAATAGLLADRLDERLWRELLRAEAALGDLGRVTELSDELASLVDRELSPYDTLQPETIALLDSLLPREPERLAR